MIISIDEIPARSQTDISAILEHNYFASLLMAHIVQDKFGTYSYSYFDLHTHCCNGFEIILKFKNWY